MFRLGGKGIGVCRGEEKTGYNTIRVYCLKTFGLLHIYAGNVRFISDVFMDNLYIATDTLEDELPL